MIPREPKWSPKQYAAIITGGYLLTGISWIFLSDFFAQELANTILELTNIQSVKGVLYVAITAVLLAGLIYITNKDQLNQTRFIGESLDTLSDSFYVVNPDRELIWFNQAACETTGYGEEELEGMAVTELFADEHESRVLASIQTTLDQGTNQVEADVVIQSGERIPHEFRGRKLTNPAGEVTGVVGIGRDISEQKERERELRVHDQFLRHNIRTSLNIILGNADDVAGGSEENAERKAAIRDECFRLLNQVEKHRKVVDVFTTRPSFVALDLVDVVANAVQDIRVDFPEAEFNVSLPDTLELTTSEAIGTALRELVENAAEHNDNQSPKVDVAVESTTDTVTIEISDNGPGIPVLEKQVLMEEIEIDQLHHGEGIGLWLAYWIVTRAEGEFEFKKQESGTTVCVQFPRQ